MPTGIDHVIVAVRELDRAIKDYTDAGFAVVPGGEHPGQGTHNALIAFADGAYLELLSFHSPNPEHRWFTRWQQNIGLVDVCLGTADLGADVAALRRAGVEMSDPVDRHRLRPDGRRVEWRFSVPQGAAARVVPFVLQDVTPRDVRVPGERTHACGVTGVESVTVATRDVEVAARWYAALGRVERVSRPDVQGEGLRVAIGPHRIDVVAPASPSSPLRPWLEAHEGGVYMAALRGPRPLDTARLGGARLTAG